MRVALLRLLLTGLVALALAGGTGHRMRPADPGLAAFLRAGGSLADICADHGRQMGGETGGPGPHCAACLPPLVGPPPGGIRMPAAARALAGRLARRAARRIALPRRPAPSARPRAPPARSPAA